MVGDPTALRGAVFADGTARPIIVSRTDREFIPAILTGLKTDDGRRQIKQTVASTRDPDNVLKLHQPVHQVFHVALVEAFCATFGSPRLDPAKIESSGLVIRRVSADNPNVMERWSKTTAQPGTLTPGEQIAGWVPCMDDDLDPDPARRRPRVTSGHAEIDRLLPLPASIYDGFVESVAPLFVAPPEVCTATQTTVLYGLVPVTSSESSEAPVAPVFDPTIVRKHLPYFLRSEESRTIPRAGEFVIGTDADGDSLRAVVGALQQLQVELDVFGDSAEGRAIFAALNAFDVNDADGNTLAKLGDFLRSAAAVLVDRSSSGVVLPARWPDIDEASTNAFTILVQKALEARLTSILSGAGRFEDPARQYQLRAFARVKRPDGCPPELIWSAPSERFTIAAWYESSGLPPAKIRLPKLDDLAALKPNVAFVMPEDLFNTLQTDSQQTLKGKSSAGGGANLGLMWICSFSIPIITICAFIVLNIFLSLFKIAFGWFFAIKICLPVPVPKGNNG